MCILEFARKHTHANIQALAITNKLKKKKHALIHRPTLNYINANTGNYTTNVLYTHRHCTLTQNEAG